MLDPNSSGSQLPPHPCLQAFQDLESLIKVLHLGTKSEESFIIRARQLRDYLSHDYSRRCQLESGCATLCIPFALCGTSVFGTTCHHEHAMRSEQCNERFLLIDDLKTKLLMLRQRTSDEDELEALDERAEELALIERHLDLYTRHLLRKALSNMITPQLLEKCKTQNRMLLIADYKQKILPGKHRETQQEGFGKRGKSLWGTTALRWDSRKQDFEVLNIRVVCDDAKQTWFHSLNCIVVTLNEVTKAWGTGYETDLQVDGASNFTCTALATSLPRVFKLCGHNIDEHIITEVGGGKNLTDTDFVHAQRSLDYEKESGGAHEDAAQILNALENHKVKGTVNAGMDLEGRKNEPKAPKPFSGIDDMYHRTYVYDESGEWIGLQLHQFFRLGDGKFVSKAVLRALWRNEELDVDSLTPKRLVASGGESVATTKLKESVSHATMTAWAKRHRRWQREQQQLEKQLQAAEVERQHAAQLTAHRCSFAGSGCRHGPFLSANGVRFHEAFACLWAREHTASAASGLPTEEAAMDVRAAAAVGTRDKRSLDALHISALVRTWRACAGEAYRRFDSSRPVRVRLAVLGGKVSLTAAAVTPSSRPVKLKLKVEWPLREQPGRQYGLQPFCGVRQHQTAKAQMLARSTYSNTTVSVTLSTWRFSASQQLPRGGGSSRKLG